MLIQDGKRVLSFKETLIEKLHITWYKQLQVKMQEQFQKPEEVKD